MARIDTRSLLFAVDGVDYSGAVARAAIVCDLGDITPVPEMGQSQISGYLNAPNAYSLSLVTVQDAAAASLYTLLWDRTYEDVEFYLAPYGNTTATDDQPHYTGTVRILEPNGDLLGGAADPSRTAVQRVTLTWPCIGGKPTKLTSGDFPGGD